MARGRGRSQPALTSHGAGAETVAVCRTEPRVFSGANFAEEVEMNQYFSSFALLELALPWVTGTSSDLIRGPAMTEDGVALSPFVIAGLVPATHGRASSTYQE